jgi:hypothetical protein
MASEDPGNHYWSVISPYWLSLNASWDRGADAFLAECRRVPAPVLHIYAGHWCQSEVDNGGFHQFFFNTTGLLAPEAAQGFRAIGLLDWSAIVSDAMNFFGDAYPRERSIRLNLLPPGEPSPFAALDQRFYESPDAARYHWERAADSYARRAV